MTNYYTTFASKANDEGLWFIAENCAEDYLQKIICRRLFAERITQVARDSRALPSPGAQQRRIAWTNNKSAKKTETGGTRPIASIKEKINEPPFFEF